MAGNGFNKTLSFGVLTIALKLHSAMRPITASLKGFHKKCTDDPNVTSEAVLQRLDKCSLCGDPVSGDQRLGGYNLEGHGFVLLTEAEVKEQCAVNDSILTVQAIVPIDSIPRERLDKAYFVGPQAPPKTGKGGAPLYTPSHKGFEMFRAGLERAGRCAIVTYAERGHEKIAVIFPQPVGCLLYECFFDAEIPEITDAFKDGTFTIPALSQKEESLGALFLQNSFAETFDFSPYEDGYVTRVHALALAKAEGRVLETPTPAPELDETYDLEAALEAALAAQAGTGKPPTALPAAPPKPVKKGKAA